MQPITQFSINPKCNDIRYLRAEQEFYGVIGCFGLAIQNRRTERVLGCGEGARRRASLTDLHRLFSMQEFHESPKD